MAASMSSSGSESFKQVDPVLTEDDIPGAPLPPPFSKYIVAELRWWLLCRGQTVSTAMKKSLIVEM